MRVPPNKNMLDKFCLEFCRIVERHTPYIIVSGFLAISSGRARATEDIDMIIPRISKYAFVKLHNDLAKKGFVCMQSSNPDVIYDDYLKDNICIRYTYKDTPLPEMEIKLAKDELDEHQLRTRTKLKLTGLDIWFSSVDVNIAFKEEYLKSPKDMEDARHLRIVYSDTISEEEIKRVKRMIIKKRMK